MMDNEADMVILFVTPPPPKKKKKKKEPLTSLEFGEILMSKSKLQILILMAYKALDVQLTKIKYNSLWWKFVMKSHDNPINPDSYFFLCHSFYCRPTLWEKVAT